MIKRSFLRNASEKRICIDQGMSGTNLGQYWYQQRHWQQQQLCNARSSGFLLLALTSRVSSACCVGVVASLFSRTVDLTSTDGVQKAVDARVNRGSECSSHKGLPFLSRLRRLGGATWLFLGILGVALGRPEVKMGVPSEICEMMSRHAQTKRTNFLGHLHKGWIPFRHHPQIVLVPFERMRESQAVAPPMGYGDRRLIPRILDGSCVSMHFCSDSATDGRLMVCEVDLGGRVSDLPSRNNNIPTLDVFRAASNLSVLVV